MVSGYTGTALALFFLSLDGALPYGAFDFPHDVCTLLPSFRFAGIIYTAAEISPSSDMSTCGMREEGNTRRIGRGSSKNCCTLCSRWWVVPSRSNGMVVGLTTITRMEGVLYLNCSIYWGLEMRFCKASGPAVSNIQW
jgi:hypothetical protein